MLNAEIQKMIGTADVQKLMHDSGLEPAAGTPQQLKQMLGGNIQKLGKIVRDAGIKIE